jgi:hypothetical protein
MTFLSPLILIFLFEISVILTKQLSSLCTQYSAHYLFAYYHLYAHNTVHIISMYTIQYTLSSLRTQYTHYHLYAHNKVHIIITYLLFPLYKKSTDKIFGIL